MNEKRLKNNNKKYIGMKFGRLTVIGFREVNEAGHHYVGWDCKCDCGNVIFGKRPGSIKSGVCSSCGCLKMEQDKHNLGESRITHGMSNTRLYGIWGKMRDRCNREKSPAYKDYGGRGIKVCSEWDKDFFSFYKWATENGYSDDLTIERKDVNGGYNPENCCWIPPEDQQKNKRSCRYVTIDGEKMTLKSACEKIGLPYKAVHLRITRRGWPVERALSEPIHENTDSLKSKCEKSGLGYATVCYRIRKLGWSEEKALTTPLQRKKKK